MVSRMMDSWPEGSEEIKVAITDWLAENEVDTLIEEGEDILDGLECMNSEGTDGVTDDVLLDVTEIVSAVIVAKDLDKPKVASIFQMAGEGTKKIKRLGRAEGMKKMR